MISDATVRDADVVCAVETLSFQVQPADAALAKKQTFKDEVLATVMRFTQEGWLQNLQLGCLESHSRRFGSL